MTRHKLSMVKVAAALAALAAIGAAGMPAAGTVHLGIEQARACTNSPGAIRRVEHGVVVTSTKAQAKVEVSSATTPQPTIPCNSSKDKSVWENRGEEQTVNVTVKNTGQCNVTVDGVVDDRGVPIATTGGNERTYSGVEVAAGSATSPTILNARCSESDQLCSWTITVNRPPATKSSAAPSDPSGLHNWYVHLVRLTLTAADEPGGSGVAWTRYAIDGKAAKRYSTPFDISADGIHTVRFWSADRAGNVEASRSTVLKVDRTAPTVKITKPRNGATYPLGKVAPVAFACADATSGLDACSGTTANGAILDTSTAGRHQLTVTATDRAGNARTATVQYTVN